MAPPEQNSLYLFPSVIYTFSYETPIFCHPRPPRRRGWRKRGSRIWLIFENLDSRLRGNDNWEL